MNRFAKLFCTVALMASASLWAAPPPAWVNFQGRLLDNNGIPVTSPPGNDMTFIVALWSDPTSTNESLHLKYRETHEVAVDDGVYSIQVGSGTLVLPCPGCVYGASLYTNNNTLWLEITVDGEKLSPRHRLLSAPYTNHSGNSEALGGQGINYFGTAATDTALQGQINGLNNQLQALCEASGNIWDAGKAECDQAVKVIDFQGKIIPVDQDAVQLSLPNDLDPGKGCTKKYYAPVLLGGERTPMTAQGCGKDPVEPPNGSLCGYGLVSAAIKIKLDDCPLMKDAGKQGGK